MRGLKHNVIEINDTKNDDIDRILVFLKPHASDVAVMNSRAEAEKILQELEVKKARELSPAAKLFFDKSFVAVHIRVKAESLSALEGIGKVVVADVFVYYLISIQYKLYIVHLWCTSFGKFLNILHLLYHKLFCLQ